MTIMCSMRRTCRRQTLWNWGEECYLIGVIDDFYMIMDTDETCATSRRTGSGRATGKGRMPMKKLLALLLMIWLLLPIAGAEEAYTMQDGSLICWTALDGSASRLL